MMYLILLYCLLHFIGHTTCTCVSYGIDFVNGGSYFIDDTESVDFTFLSQFEGCDNEEITPILVDPDENEYFCSDIATSPDDTSLLSTCPILQTAMYSGTWYIVIEGLTFAYVRTFTITAGVPTTITATPTITVGITIVPDAVTSTTTSTSTGSTTILPSTVTDACKTFYITSFVIPPPTYKTVTKTISLTSTLKTISTTTSSTLTSTAVCTPPPFPKGADPALQKVLALPHTTISPPAAVQTVQSSSKTKSTGKHGKRDHARDIAYPKVRGLSFNLARNAALLKRGPDEATVTTTETTYTSTSTTTTTLLASTVIQTNYTTAISTITPAPVTVCHGITIATTTKTLPQMTITILKLTQTTIYVTKSITVCHTFKTTTTPRALSTSCIAGGGHV